jgi:hypothetical protein
MAYVVTKQIPPRTTPPEEYTIEALEESTGEVITYRFKST